MKQSTNPSSNISNDNMFVSQLSAQSASSLGDITKNNLIITFRNQ